MGQPIELPNSAPRAIGTDRIYIAAILAVALIAPYSLLSFSSLHNRSIPTRKTTAPLSQHVVSDFENSLVKCKRLHLLPGPPSDFNQREQSDRFVEGTNPILIRNASIWTGDDDVFKGDLFINKGLILKIESDSIDYSTLPVETEVHEAFGAWLTPGIFDMHSHIGVESAPALKGAGDGNSISKPILPYLRSLDSINTHDASFARSRSGGITTSLVLPGSANNIGGQAFAIKLRATKAKTPESLVLEMPYNVKSEAVWREGEPPRFRHMKAACGENIRRVYKQTRMDLSWNFRSSLEKARQLKVTQNNFCEDVLAAHAKGEVVEGKFPDDLEWEMLVDVLRGKVKVNAHCYESTDLAAFIRHTNEFQFPLAAFHHAHETFQVPDLLKSAWNSTPAVAIFATNGRYKREAWRGSEYAGKILHENNITVIMKSDHPVLDSRYLLFEAQQAHHFGLPENVALAALMTSPAKVAGFDHRIGYLKLNYDADLVLWDSHPLSLGATPLQVYIDGIPQLQNVFSAKPLDTSLVAPPIASMPIDPITLQEDDDSYRGTVEVEQLEEIFFENVAEVLLNGKEKHAGLHSYGQDLPTPFSVHIKDGSIHCIGVCALPTSSSTPTVDLKGGSLLPPLIAFGPALGLTEIISEASTSDQEVYDPLIDKLSKNQAIWGPKVTIRAVDGLGFGGKHLRLAERAGVGKAVTAPMGNGFFRGVSVAFRTGAANVLESHAIIKEIVALHITIGHYKGSQTPSISTQIAELRRLLLANLGSSHARDPRNYFALAAMGKIPLVINAWKADVIASIILLKREVEEILEREVEVESRRNLNWIIHGGQEAHLIANELAGAEISVILSPPRAFPESWDERRALPGPPTTQRNAANTLHNAGVNLALGVPEEWQSLTLLWEAAWAAKVSNGEISRKDAIAWLTSNLERMLDLPSKSGSHHLEFVAHERDPMQFGSRAVAMSSGNGKKVELMQ